MSDEICKRCGKVGQDRRTLQMACGYEMNEIGLPFVPLGIHYTLNVCKECRGDWMLSLKHWFENPIPQESVNSGIFIREFGGLREITREEWDRRKPGKEPFIYKEAEGE